MTAGSRPGVSGPRRVALPPFSPARRPYAALAALLLLLLALLAGCGSSAAPERSGPVLTIGAIPDQDPQQLQRRYATVADRLSSLLGVPVEYRPVTDYPAAVSLFRTGDLQLVWFGGLTGVQARLQTPGAVPLVQRDIDAQFHSLFLGHASAGLPPIRDVAGLHELAGTRFTYGSQSSTSGYLMPAYYLDQAGVHPEHGFAGTPGLSGSHDKTIDLVASGTYQAGAVNEQVWQARLAAGTVDPEAVQVLFRTPPYADYHWLLSPRAVEQFGADFPSRVSAALTGLDAADPADADVLELFGAKRFVPTTAANYTRIEQIGRQLGLVTGP
ncbi:MAG: putative selenate ABC transporter substrate-binding protein [Actinomycetes bacterium]